MKRFRFKTPGGEVVEQSGGADEGETVFRRTEKGDDLFPIYELIAERANTTDEKRRAEIIREILPLKQAFEAVWNEDPLDLIVELFGGEEGGGDE